MFAPGNVDERGARRPIGREPEQSVTERLGGQMRTREVQTGEEDEGCLHEDSERLGDRALTGLPRQDRRELVDRILGAGGQQRHADGVHHLALVVQAAEEAGVAVRVAHDDPLREVVLRSGFLREEAREDRIAGHDHRGDVGLLEPGDDRARRLLGGGEVELVGEIGGDVDAVALEQ